MVGSIIRAGPHHSLPVPDSDLSSAHEISSKQKKKKNHKKREDRYTTQLHLEKLPISNEQELS